MNSKVIELSVLGQILRLNCPEQQHDALKQSAKELELYVNEMRERTGILQLERILAIVALNLNYELNQEKQKNMNIESNLKNRIEQLDHSLDHILTHKVSS